MAQIFAQNLQQVFDEGSAGSSGRGQGRGGGSAAAAAQIGAKFTDASKKKKEETKSGKKTRCQRQQRRYGDVDVSVGGSPCLTQLCTKFMIFYLSVQWERESSRHGHEPGQRWGEGDWEGAHCACIFHK